MQYFLGSQVGALSLKFFLALVVVFFVHYPFFGQSFSENFEHGIKDEFWAFEGHDNTTSSKHSISGTKSYRAYLPAKKYSNARSEIRFRGGDGVPGFLPKSTTWGTRFAIYFPKDFQPDESSSEIIAQYHGVADPGDTFLSPPWALRLRGKKLSVTNRTTDKKNSTISNVSEKTWSLSGNIVPGKWHYFVVDIHWDNNPNGNGFMKFYMKIDGAPGPNDIKVNYSGPTGYNDRLGAYFKIGIYKWDWKKQDRVTLSKKEGVTERLLFFDDVAIKKKGYLSNEGTSVNKSPSANAGNDLDILLDDQTEVTVKGSGSDPDGEIAKYRWSQITGPNEVTFSNQNSAQVTLQNLVEGLYVLRLVVTDDEGATDNDDMLLKVTSNLNHPPTTNAGPNVTLVLPENSLALQGIATDPDDGDSVERLIWTQSDGPTEVVIENATQLNARVENLVVGRYVFKLKAYDKSGAEGYDHISVFVLRPEDLPNITADIKDASCNSKDGSIKLAVSGGSSPYTYKWSTGSTSKDLSNVARGEYEVVVTGSDGWSSSQTLSVGGITSRFQVEADIADTHCSSRDGSIKLKVSGGKAPYIYEWNHNSVNTSELNNLSEGIYKVTVTDDNGCSEKYSFTVNVASGPTNIELETTIENASCAGDDGSIQLVVLEEYGPYTYRWSHGASGPRIRSLSEGRYTVTVTDKHGCFMDKTFTVNQQPGLAKPQINQFADSLFVTQNASGYQWFKEGNKITGANSQKLKITEPGTYSIQIHNEQGCTSSSDYFDAQDPRPYARSIDQSLTFQHFEFYPNPAVIDMNVVMAVSQPADVVIEVLDFQGKNIQSKDLGRVYSRIQENINVASYPSGIYLLRVKAGDEIITRRFVKP